MGSIGPMELMLIALIAILLFGGGRIAGLGKGLGQSIRGFKEGLKDSDEDEKKAAAAKKEEASKAS